MQSQPPPQSQPPTQTQPQPGAGADSTWTTAPSLPALLGDETFVGTAEPFTVLDFWRYAMPDLRTNTTRGLLAEFLVHRALGAQVRNQEWDSFDVLTPDGLRVEVKSSAYVQAWDQRSPSAIRFGRLRGRVWTPQGGGAEAPTFNADVYVFALHSAPDHDSYNPLDIGQWLFHVLPAPRVEALGQASLGLTALRRLSGDPVPYAELAPRVRAADPRPARAGTPEVTAPAPASTSPKPTSPPGR
ncbi:hypothetical protein [Streptacidiphilus cavernicola]|uniref:Uncharacterized protein n=1 Tax=Streptacidiphilus cavernicola TaxID=3342716 RepID=A0ABV6VVT4_9ACTN